VDVISSGDVVDPVAATFADSEGGLASLETLYARFLATARLPACRAQDRLMQDHLSRCHATLLSVFTLIWEQAERVR